MAKGSFKNNVFVKGFKVLYERYRQSSWIYFKMYFFIGCEARHIFLLKRSLVRGLDFQSCPPKTCDIQNSTLVVTECSRHVCVSVEN